MSLLSRILFPQNEQRTITSGNFMLPWNSFESTGDEEFSQGGAMSIVTFFTCVSILADAVSSLKIKAYRPDGDVDNPVKTQPLLLQRDPYPGINWQQWLWMLMEALCVTGNGYLWITDRDDRGYPTALMPVHPRFVTVELPEANIMEWPDPKYHINGHYVPSEDIVHIKKWPVAGSVLGMSPVQQLRHSIQMSLEVEKYGHQWFKDSAMPSGVLSSDQDLTETQVKKTLKLWMMTHRQRRVPAVVGAGLQWTPMTLSPEESQFLDTRQYQRSELAMLFRIPPHMLGDSTKATSWGSGISSMGVEFLQFTLEPWLNLIEAALADVLPGAQRAKFDIDGIKRGDPETRWKIYQMGRDMGVYSVNDILRMEGQPPIGPEGDIRLQPMNYVPLGTPVSEYLGKGSSADSGDDPDDDDPPAAAARKVPA